MNKKNIIILSLLSAFFSLLYILSNQFGLFRYISMFIFPIEKYVNNYKNLDKITNKIIISIITTDKQLDNIKYTIKSLLDQTVKVDLISITLPHDNKFILSPELAKTVVIYKCGDEKTVTSNLNCLLSTIFREGETTTKLITLKGGVIYGKDFIETLLNSSEKNPDTIIYINSIKDSIDLEKGALFNMGIFDDKFNNISDNVDANEYINKYIHEKSYKKLKINYSENYKY